MPLFAEATHLTPEQIQQLADEAARLKALPAEQVAAMAPDQLRHAHGVIEQARWATEVPYFRWLHDVLPTLPTAEAVVARLVAEHGRARAVAVLCAALPDRG